MKKGRIRAMVLLFTLAVAAGVWAQERIDLTTPDSVPTNLSYRLERLTLTFDNPATASIDEGVIHIQLMGRERPVALSCTYSASTSPTATSLLVPFVKANLSTAYTGAGTGSLPHRIFHRLVVMNEAPAVCGRSLAGTVAGTPQ